MLNLLNQRFSTSPRLPQLGQLGVGHWTLTVIMAFGNCLVARPQIEWRTSEMLKRAGCHVHSAGIAGGREGVFFIGC